MKDERKKESLQDRVLAMRGESRSEGEEAAQGGKPPLRPPKRCKITVEEFLEQATDLVVVLEGQPRVVSRKVFSSGSFGWMASEKMDFMVAGQPIRCQIAINVIAIGSKPEARAPSKEGEDT